MRCLFLVGLPGSGKSTYRDKLVHQIAGTNLSGYYTFISSDDIIEGLAERRGQTYNDIFVDQYDEGLIDACMTRTDDEFNAAVTLGQYIVIDRTNMSQKSRAKYLGVAKGSGYVCDAVVFARPMTDKAHTDWNNRLERPGKSIPNDVLQQMFRDYERPTVEEGFANVFDIDSFERSASV